ncbi:50S ribosomal protein L24 [Halothermothrix orenii]|uniref:Large ribosomal subunit protein uL24 n=1 Tax=Halothermothrix orenii (strain H 168 / OCM 544 / DSM 9562) TaxID=373903 RepID=RL24_HALOH|nr:50S ribosomal protein L24 [Halothermothrix orenii]B8D0D5.1 RecName: Full=Large ribosomal subunit protein uL24; AltName: Full=50S ribosomal protein L24 [Halothermothrix orenii H 168]ACL68889.1 ribosomal protein L24 [Halothermothrix orenii H 168]
MRVKKGDLVEVIAGKDRGKRGKVLRVIPREDRVIVEGINIVHRHMRPTPDMPQGGIVKNEAPIHISNVMLVCPNCDEKTRIGATYLEDGQKVRKCKKCDEVVDK